MIFSTAFLAIVMKYVNDALWWLVILVIVKNYLPQKDASKVLALFMTLVYIFMSLGPIVGSLVFAFLAPAYLFGIVLVLNIAILCVLLRSDLFNDAVMSNKEKKGAQALLQGNTE